MTFCPEWVTGSPNLDSSEAWSFWVYLVVRVISIPQPRLCPLKSNFPPVHESYLGLGSTLAHVGFLPRYLQVFTFDP